MLANQIQVRPTQGCRQIIQVASGLALPGFTMYFGRDEEIYGESEPAEFVYRVVSGVVRTHLMLNDGRRQVIAFHFAGDLFGLEPGEAHASSAEAVTTAEIALVKRCALDRAMAQDASVARKLLMLSSIELKRAQDNLLLLGRKTALERVSSFLIEMADRDPDECGVKIPMSRTDIADYLGLTIETVSRTLSQLERNGVISLPSCRQIILRDRKMLS